MVQVVEIGLLKFFAEYDRTPELQEICNVMGKKRVKPLVEEKRQDYQENTRLKN